QASPGHRLLGVSHLLPPALAVFEAPACIEHGVDEAPVLCPCAIEVQLRAENIQSTAIDGARHRAWIAGELTHVEAAVADEALGIDRQPFGSVRAKRAEDVVVVQVPVHGDGLSGGCQEFLPHGVCTLEEPRGETLRAAG